MESQSVGEVGRILLDPVLPRLGPVGDADLVARKERSDSATNTKDIALVISTCWMLRVTVANLNANATSIGPAPPMWVVKSSSKKFQESCLRNVQGIIDRVFQLLRLPHCNRESAEDTLFGTNSMICIPWPLTEYMATRLAEFMPSLRNLSPIPGRGGSNKEAGKLGFGLGGREDSGGC